MNEALVEGAKLAWTAFCAVVEALIVIAAVQSAEGKFQSVVLRGLGLAHVRVNRDVPILSISAVAAPKCASSVTFDYFLGAGDSCLVNLMVIAFFSPEPSFI